MSTQEFNFPVNIPFGEEVQWNTLITKYEDGKEQRRKKWSSPKRAFSISLKGKSKSEANRLWDFYNARSGAFDTFYFENENESPITDEQVGTGNGAATVFQLQHSPLPSGAITITVGGTAQAETTDYTLTRSTGAITFLGGSIPPSGDAILGTYRFCRVVRFAEDKLTRELFNFQLYNQELKLIEVL